MAKDLPRLVELRVGDPPERWAALGFAVGDDGSCDIGGVRLALGGPGRGIVSWAIHGIDPDTEAIDGLPTAATPRRVQTSVTHPNGAVGIDHVVVTTPDFDRSVAAFERAGMQLKRIRDAGGFRQGFRRLGPTILELVEARTEPVDGRAGFWGLVVVAADLEVLAARLGDRLGEIRDAVQPGRRIATLRASAGLTPNVAFMTPES
jgi:hypothetical protein